MRAVIYVRDNRTENEEDSLESQLEECLQYATEHRLEVVAVYKDRGPGCIDWGHRDELEALLDDAEKNAFDIVIVAEVACISLCFFELYYCFKKFWERGLGVSPNDAFVG